ncbi:conserved hypothetical protein [Paecilomyces variotii No. 5]|uniref:Transcription factor domain-containing protein n=1 Tax=Byssochlamys spectabilis (strain No. 5 / NBRC 109023) TaxID=1356009 RepID=V5G6G2_BYSSN|nr:conserved hypothetical protein [Paecilomyces variotii No. 5]
MTLPMDPSGKGQLGPATHVIEERSVISPTSPAEKAINILSIQDHHSCERSQGASPSLAERIHKIEKILTERLSTTDKSEIEPTTDDRRYIAPAAQSLGTCFGKLHFAGRNLGDISSYNGIPFFSIEGQHWVEARTGQRIDFDKLCALGPPWQNRRNLSSDAVLMKLQSSGTLELPDRRLVDDYVHIYNTTVFRRVFPVVNTTLFTETINAAYGHGDTGQYYQNASSKACIYAFLAFCSVLNIRGRAAPTVDSEGYALKAQCLLPQVLREPASLDGLQTAVMIYVEGLYARFDGQSSPNNFREVPLFPLDLRLSMIKSRAYDALYSVRALQKTDAELLRAIRELDADLERWRVSLPPRVRPTVSFSYEMPIDATMDMGVVMMRLDYHHCMATIHQATSRCKAWTGPEDCVMDGVGSSLALSVEASRSTVFYLQTAEHVLGDDCFWIVLFYPMSAFLTIFCHVLLHPLHPQADKDVELLRKAPILVRGILGRQLSVNEIIHVKVITEFVAELGRLAKCAIEKARIECCV